MIAFFLTAWAARPVTSHNTAAAAGQAIAAGAVVRMLHAGQYREALQALEQLNPGTHDGAGASARAVVEARLLAALVIDSWQLAEPLDPARLDPQRASAYWYVRGVLAARAAWPGGRAEPMALARAAAGHLESLGAPLGRMNRIEARRAAVLAAMAAAQEERDELALLLGHAQHIDAQLRSNGLPDDTVLPLDELAGDLWLQVFRYADAIRHYEQALARHADRTRAWLGLARAAREADDRGKAAAAARQVLDRWGNTTELDAIKREMRELIPQ